MDFALISCNIRFDNPGDKENSWNYRKNLLVNTLKNHSPLLIATQEGRFDQLNELNTLLADYELIDSHRSWIKPRMYPSFFIKKNFIHVLKSQDIWLSETPDVAGSSSFNSAFPRLMTWIKIQLNHTNEKFFIVNTHLDHVNQETRIHQIKVLCHELMKIRDDDSKIIIMGDFNDPPEGPVRSVILEYFPTLIDSWKLFNSLEETSHHAFNGEDQNGSRIDWILTDQNLKIKNCFMDKTHDNGRFPTDHFPIVCKFIL